LNSAFAFLVVTGRGARDCGAALTRLLDTSGALYLDTQESRGLVDPAHRRSSARCAAAPCRSATSCSSIGSRNPDKTAEAFEGLWCSVGDMARRDADGYIHLIAERQASP